MLKELVAQLYKDVEAAAKKSKEYAVVDTQVIDLYNDYLKEAKAQYSDNKRLRKLSSADYADSYAKLTIFVGQLKVHVSDGD